MRDNKLILAKDQYYSLDCYETQLNNNVLVVGSSGTGKTRSVVSPNILQATGSYIVTDPKGNLYGKYGDYLREKGYEVKKLDFVNPKDSIGYNFFQYIKSEQDIGKVAHMLVNQRDMTNFRGDFFWDEATELLLQALIAYLLEQKDKSVQNLHELLSLVEKCSVEEGRAHENTPLDNLFRVVRAFNKNSYAARQYRKFRIGASRTLRSILISLNAKLGRYDSSDLSELLKVDEVNLEEIGQKKTALFVVVSDTDRSLDGLVNIFFTQAMNTLCNYADNECENNELPVPVRFIMDDFATNCTILDFPKMISSIRSRGISAMLMLQAESQLQAAYGADDKTIIGNCDTYIYMGGNDVETAENVARRCNVPADRILYMPVGKNWIFRRGQKPIMAENFVLEEYFER